jgi:hypothetical protein
MDPNFTARRPLDRMVGSKSDDTASAHLTEDGYVKHRIAELLKKRFPMASMMNVAKSA